MSEITEYITIVRRVTDKTAWHIRRGNEPMCCCGKVETRWVVNTCEPKSQVKVAGTCQKAFDQGHRGPGRVLDESITVNIYCNKCNGDYEVPGNIQAHIEGGGGCHTCAYDYTVMTIYGSCPDCNHTYEREYHGY